MILLLNKSMDVIPFEIPDLSFFKQAREAAAAIQGKMVDMQRKKSKGPYSSLVASYLGSNCRFYV